MFECGRSGRIFGVTVSGDVVKKVPSPSTVLTTVVVIIIVVIVIIITIICVNVRNGLNNDKGSGGSDDGETVIIV
jgi:heme/copper-type cytochrome/quinol oxidase subunit 2